MEDETEEEKMQFFIDLFHRYEDIIIDSMTEEEKKLYLEKKND